MVETVEAHTKLASADVEIKGLLAQQQKLMHELQTEKAARKKQARELVSLQESLAATRQQLLSGTDERLAEAHKKLHTAEAEVNELRKRLEKMSASAAMNREEVTMRAEQQRLLADKLRVAEESLAARSHLLSERDQVTKAQMAQVAGSAERLAESFRGTEELQVGPFTSSSLFQPVTVYF